MFSYALQWLHVSRCGRLCTSCIFFRAWLQLHGFSRSAPAVCFLAVGTVCMFSRARYRRLFPALGTRDNFPRLVPAACFCFEFSLVHHVICIYCGWPDVTTLFKLFLPYFDWITSPACRNLSKITICSSEPLCRKKLQSVTQKIHNSCSSML